MCALLYFTLLCFAWLGLALLCSVWLGFALLCFVSLGLDLLSFAWLGLSWLCCALLCFAWLFLALLCFALLIKQYNVFFHVGFACFALFWLALLCLALGMFALLRLPLLGLLCFPSITHDHSVTMHASEHASQSNPTQSWGPARRILNRKSDAKTLLYFPWLLLYVALSSFDFLFRINIG